MSLFVLNLIHSYEVEFLFALQVLYGGCHCLVCGLCCGYVSTQFRAINKNGTFAANQNVEIMNYFDLYYV